MKEFYLFSIIKDLMIKTLEKVSQNFCFVYKFETLTPFSAIGSSGSLVLKGVVKREKGVVYSNFGRKIFLSLNDGKVYRNGIEINPYDFITQNKLIEELSHYEKEALCVTERRKVKVKVIDGENVLPRIDNSIKNELTQVLFSYFKKEIGFTFDKPITVYKLVANKTKAYLQFASNWSFWYVELEEFAKRDYSLVTLIKLKRDLIDTLNK